IIHFLSEESRQSSSFPQGLFPQWTVSGTDDFRNLSRLSVSLYLHRIVRLADLLELHFILSFWAYAQEEGRLAGWVLQLFERHPLIPDRSFDSYFEAHNYQLKIRRSDEDPRAIWKLISDDPLRLSLAYVATITPKAL